MKVRLYNLLIDIFLLIGVGIPLIFIGVLDTWRTILTIAIIVFTLIYVIMHRLNISKNNKFLYIYVFGVLGIVAYEIIMGSRSFKYSSYETFYALRQYLWIILAIPLYNIIIKYDNIDKFLNSIINIVLLSLGLRAFTWFCNNYLRISIFDNLLYEYGNLWGRNGNQRLDATSLIGILIPLLFYFYKKYKKKKYLYSMGFVFLYLVFVSQTRTLILGYIICVIIMLFFEKRSSTKRLIFQLTIIFVFALAVNLGFVDFILNKLNISLNDGSISFRQYEYAYYSSLLLNGKWITGLGIITSLNSEGNRLLFGNLNTQMYLEDLGIFECFLQFGLFTIFLYGFLLIYIVYVILKCNRERRYDFSFYLIGQFFYIAIVSIPLNLFGIQRIFSIPIIVAIVCAIHYSVIKKVKVK